MDFFNDIFHNLALLEFYFLNIIYILLYIDFILSIFFQHSNILTRASHHWCLASNIVLVTWWLRATPFEAYSSYHSDVPMSIKTPKTRHSIACPIALAHQQLKIKSPHYWSFVRGILCSLVGVFAQGVSNVDNVSMPSSYRLHARCIMGGVGMGA